MINILYVSSFCSSKLITEMFEAGYKPIQAIQKFNTLLVRGLVENGCNVYALSQIPKTAIPKFYSRRKETEKGIRFKYSINIDIINNNKKFYIFNKKKIIAEGRLL